MSYDTYMMMDTGGETLATVCEIGNMTSNVSPMWTKALGFPLSDMEGWTGKECAPHLERALKVIGNPETRSDFEAMNPSNGWGNVGSAEEYLKDIFGVCKMHPKAKLFISR